MLIKIFIKNLVKNFLYFRIPCSIMLVGLSIAYLSLYIILLQLQFEFNYNKSFKNFDSLYRLEYYDSDIDDFSPFLPKNYVDYLKDKLPELYNSCVFQNNIKASIVFNNSNFKADIGYADTGMVSLFNLNIIQGDYKKALAVRNNALIPYSLATKIFKNKDPIGQVITVNGEIFLTIAAIYKDIADNASLKNNIYTCLPPIDNWESWIYYNYYSIPKGSDIRSIEEKINNLDRKSDDILFSATKKLRPLNEVYYASEGDIKISLALLFTGILILIIALINFINYINSLAPYRLQWFNIQKICGMPISFARYYLIGETIFYSFISCIVALILSIFISETAIQSLLFTSANFSLHLNFSFQYICLSIIIGILTGLYPAYYMSNFQPAMVLKRKNTSSFYKGENLRNVLVMFQFITSIILIILSVFIHQQLTMVKNKSWGIQKDNVVYIQINKEIEKQKDAFAEELKKNPQITDVTFSYKLLGSFSMEGTDVDIGGEEKRLWYYSNSATANYIDFWNIKINEGKNHFADHDTCAIANEAFVHIVGKEQTLQKRLGRVPIKSICKNFNFSSLKNNIKPLILYINESYPLQYCYIRISTPLTEEIKLFINSKIKEFSPDLKNDIIIVDDFLNAKYVRETDFKTLISSFCFLSILLSMMGIFSLVLFNFKLRIKEICIRKIQGATITDIFFLLNKQYLKLFVIAFVMASPFAWYLTSLWLDNFAYKIDISIEVFLLSGLLILILLLLTVSWHSWKNSSINPADILKSE